MNGRIVVLTGFLLVVFGADISPAFADCVNPSAPEGRVVYNTTHKVAQFCNGTHWISMAGGGASTVDPRIGALGADKWCVSNGAGDKIECTADLPSQPVPGSDKQVIFNDGGSALAGASQLFWDKTTSRLGIGTDAPVSALAIKRPTGTITVLTLEAEQGAVTPSKSAVIEFRRHHFDPSGRAAAIEFHRGGAYAEGEIAFMTNPGPSTGQMPTERMRIKDNGRIGIGTTSPTSLLHVAGGLQVGIDTADCPGVSNVKLGTLRFSAGAFNVCVAGGWTPLATGTGALAAGSTGQIQFNGGTGTFAADAGLHWDNTNKRLGIGTATPQAALHVQPNGTTLPAITSGTAGVFARTSASNAYSSVSIIAGNASASNLNFGDTDHEYPGYIQYDHAGNFLRFIVDAGERLRIDSSGNVGIGTASPGEKLVIDNHAFAFHSGGTQVIGFRSDYQAPNWVRQGGAAYQGLLSYSPVSGSFIIASSNTDASIGGFVNQFLTLAGDTGNVGIARASPATRLHVGGGVQMGDDAGACPGTSNVKLGAMRYSSGAFSVCLASGWTPLLTGTGALAAGSTGQIQFNGGTGAFAADAGLNWNNSTKQLNVSGTTRLDGNVGVNTSPVSYASLYAYKSSGTPGISAIALRGDTLKNPSASGTHYDIGLQAVGWTSIPAGVTDSGYLTGANVSVLRSTDQTTDAGTLASLSGVSIAYGHYVRSGAPPLTARTTTEAYGIHIIPYHQDGTISNSYGLYIRTPVTGGAVGKEYGIYQASTNARNYFGGNVGIGTVNPVSRLHVDGGIQLADDGAICPGVGSVKLGTMKYVTNTLSVCNSSGWTPLATGTGALAAGSTGQIQFNGGSGAFAADAGLHWDNTNKRLGIGTATPFALLEVNDGTYSMGLAGTGIYFRRNAANYIWGASAGGYLIFGGNGQPTNVGTANFYTSGTNQNVIFNGNVGIGAVNPVSRLHVDGSINISGTQASLALENSDTAIYSEIRLQNPSATDPLRRLRILAYNDDYSAGSMGSMGAGASTLAMEGGPLVLGTTGSFPIVLANGTTRIMTVASNGNGGIGATSPEAKLQVHGSTTTGNITSLLLSQGTAATGEQNSLVFKVSTHYGAAVAMETRSTSDFDMVFKTNTSGGNNLTEKMRITHNGNVGIGTSSPQYMLDVSGSARIGILRGGGGSNFHIDANDSTRGIYLNWYSTGDVYARNTLLASSDERLKRNIAVLPNALERITQLRGVSFEWKDSARPGKQIGVIAQDVEKVYPELVAKDQDGYKTVAYANMVAPLIEAVKELKADNDNLRAELKAANDHHKRAIEALREEIDAMSRHLAFVK